MALFNLGYICGLCLLSACIENQFNTRTDDNNPPLEDCPTDLPVAQTPPLSPDCFADPVIGPFDPVIEWEWGHNPVDEAFFQVENPPIVANLTDDNGDGAIDDLDTPDVIVTAFAGGDFTGLGYVFALSGDTGDILWYGNNYDGATPWGLSGPAVGDVDADGLPDIFIPADRGLLRLTHEGEFVWICKGNGLRTTGGGQSVVSLADLEGDGIGEAILHGSVCNADGSVRWSADDNGADKYYGSFAADLDQDGFQEIIANGTVFNHDGSVRWVNPKINYWSMSAIGDLDGDGIPEIIGLSEGPPTHILSVLDIDGNLIWEHAFSEMGGAIPTVADFDGDGAAEIGIATQEFYYVFEGDGSIRWRQPTNELSSGVTGSAVFDFEGDGAAEVVYADEEYLWVFDGASSTVELKMPHTSGTRWEYPTIADVDGDGSAEILLPQGREFGADDFSVGLTVIGSATSAWEPARPIWNQHAYSITNINDDGSIPERPDPNWETYNNFRAANASLKNGLALPDLAIGEPEICEIECLRGNITLSFPIENRGTEFVNESITIGIYAIETVGNRLIREVTVSELSARSTKWLGPYDIDTDKIGEMGLYLIVNEDGRNDECDAKNNAVVVAQDLCASNPE